MRYFLPARTKAVLTTERIGEVILNGGQLDSSVLVELPPVTQVAGTGAVWALNYAYFEWQEANAPTLQNQGGWQVSAEIATFAEDEGLIFKGISSEEVHASVKWAARATYGVGGLVSVDSIQNALTDGFITSAASATTSFRVSVFRSTGFTSDFDPMNIAFVVGYSVYNIPEIEFLRIRTRKVC